MKCAGEIASGGYHTYQASKRSVQVFRRFYGAYASDTHTHRQQGDFINLLLFFRS
jgi:hypothetical protein